MIFLILLLAFILLFIWCCLKIGKETDEKASQKGDDK